MKYRSQIVAAPIAPGLPAAMPLIALVANIPAQVGLYPAAMFVIAPMRFPRRYIGLLPYTFAKGITRSGPTPAQQMYIVSSYEASTTVRLNALASGTNAGLATAEDIGPRKASQLTCKTTRSF